MAVLATEVCRIPKFIKFVRFIKDFNIIYGLVIAPLEVLYYIWKITTAKTIISPPSMVAKLMLTNGINDSCEGYPGCNKPGVRFYSKDEHSRHDDA